MKIFFAIRLNEYWQDKYDLLKREFPDIEFINDTEPESKLQLLEDADAVVAGRLTEDEIKNAANLKAVFVPFTGLNGFPVNLLHNKKIIISNTHANSVPVAEHALTLALAVLHRVTEFHNDLAVGEWHWEMETDHWTILTGRKCSILGYGSIGMNLGRMLSAFKCKVYAYKKDLTELYDLYASEISSDLNYIINKGEIIFVCLPLTDETKCIINKDVIDSMQGKYIINIGRGGLIDEDALYNSLKNGHLKGAGLDVWFKYPSKGERTGLPANQPFHELKNVVMTPHKAGHTIESIYGMIDDTYQNIRSFIINGKPDIMIPADRTY